MSERSKDTQPSPRAGPGPAPALAASSASAPWQPLGYFNAYRLVLAGLFVTLVTWGAAPRPLGQYDGSLFQVTAIAYFVVSVAACASTLWRWPSFNRQVLVQVSLDIVAITLLMHASGGVTSGFGMLMVVAIAGGSILTQPRIAILFAALASLSVLGQQIYLWLKSPWLGASYPHAGMLGAVFFATAYLVFISARRIRTSETLAARREVDLANLAELNEHIIQRMQSGILAIDENRRIRLVNKSAERLLGLSRGQEGERLERVAVELDRLHDRWYADPSQATYLMSPGDAQTQVQASFAALGSGAQAGALVFLEDASSITQRAQELKLASLGRLAGSIAHEIRNPLSAVSHANQLLNESARLDRSDQRLTQIINDNSERMNAIIENVLQLGRGKPALPETIDLRSWLDEFVADFVANRPIEAGQIALSVQPENLRVRADPSQLHQVLSNLFENATQHAHEPAHLELRAGIHPDTRRPYLEVEDNGDGISATAAQHIFEPFFTTRSSGTGLGLYIARELCEGNQASLSHLPGAGGCCFRVTFADPRRQTVAVAVASA